MKLREFNHLETLKREFMEEKKRNFYIRSKIWIEDDQGKPVFGLGRVRILTAIQQQGSILAAAKELKMSYRAVWGRLRATEERLGQPLLERSIGGACGGGSTLTPFALSLLEQFDKLNRQIRDESDALFDTIFLQGG